jgi:hypothetical protein
MPLHATQDAREIVLDLIQGALDPKITFPVLKENRIPIRLYKRLLRRFSVLSGSVLRKFPKSPLLPHRCNWFKPRRKIAIGNDVLSLVFHREP